MEAMDEDGEIVETEEIERIGVGEVFVTCGQSNSLNFGETLTKAKSNMAVCLLCCNEKDVLKGPDSDILQGDYRMLNSAYFTLSGLKAHGKLWADEILKHIQ